jgi:hypothetical protein
MWCSLTGTLFTTICQDAFAQYKLSYASIGSAQFQIGTLGLRTAFWYIPESKIVSCQGRLLTCKCSCRQGWPKNRGGSFLVFLTSVNFSWANILRSSNASVISISTRTLSSSVCQMGCRLNHTFQSLDKEKGFQRGPWQRSRDVPLP